LSTAIIHHRQCEGFRYRRWYLVAIFDLMWFCHNFLHNRRVHALDKTSILEMQKIYNSDNPNKQSRRLVQSECEKFKINNDFMTRNFIENDFMIYLKNRARNFSKAKDNSADALINHEIFGNGIEFLSACKV
jgi:hypothetical protein